VCASSHPLATRSDLVTPGWVRVYRSLLDHPIWTAERFARGQAWLDLIMRAAYEDHESFTTHGPDWIKRGQVLTTQVALAERWRWDRETVRSFLDTLKRRSMIVIETSKATSTGYTLITIRNYERFQGCHEKGLSIESGIVSTGESRNRAASMPQPCPTSEEGEEGEEGQEGEERSVPRERVRPGVREHDAMTARVACPSWETAAPEVAPDPLFARFWEAYPKKVARPAALKAWHKLRPDEALFEKMLAALEVQRQSQNWTKDRGLFIPYPATWLNNRRWEDEQLERPAPTANEPRTRML
jgi:hypothetical protein